MRNRFLLKLGAGLTAVLLVGFFLVLIIFRAPPNSASKTVFRGTVEMPRQTFRINAQSRSGDTVGHEEGTIDLGKKKQPIEAQKSQPAVTRLPERQNTATTGSEPSRIGASSTLSKEKAPPFAATENSSQFQSGTKEHHALNSETAMAAAPPTKEFRSIEIGPIITKQELKKVTRILHRNGFDFQQALGMGTVKVTRLLDGVYPREKVHKRFKEVQAVVDTAFIIPEKEKFAIYVATYRDRAKAIQRSKHLAQKNIHVTAVDAEIEMNGTILSIKQVGGSNIETITDQISQMGLSVKINK
jgi:hypothetical protein